MTSVPSYDEETPLVVSSGISVQEPTTKAATFLTSSKLLLIGLGSIAMLLVCAMTAPASLYGKPIVSYQFSVDPIEIINPVTMDDFVGKNGQRYRFPVTGSTRGHVWGSDIYTSDSDIATAAVHAGLVEKGETKEVMVEMTNGLDAYFSSVRNGVTTEGYDDWEGSYQFVYPNGEIARALPVDNEAAIVAYDFQGYSKDIGKIYKFSVTGKGQDGSVWGSEIYTDDSSVGEAAVHFGLVAVGETKTLFLEAIPGQKAYTSSTRNGITTRAYGEWGGSFKFVDSYDPVVVDPTEEPTMAPTMPAAFTCKMEFIDDMTAYESGIVEGCVYMSSTDLGYAENLPAEGILACGTQDLSYAELVKLGLITDDLEKSLSYVYYTGKETQFKYYSGHFNDGKSYTFSPDSRNFYNHKSDGKQANDVTNSVSILNSNYLGGASCESQILQAKDVLDGDN